MKQKIFYKMLFIFLIGLSFTYADANISNIPVAEPIEVVTNESDNLTVKESDETVRRPTSGLEIYDDPDCENPMCGCRSYYTYDSAKGDCVIDLPSLMKKTVVYYGTQNNEADILARDDMAKSIYIEGQQLFRGIIISVILFITCASLCVLSACIYCCKINYSDRKLKQEVEALAKKMHKTSILKKQSVKPKPEEPMAQSCNVIVGQAGVFVV